MAIGHVTVQVGTELLNAYPDGGISVGTLLRGMEIDEDGYITLNGRDCELGDEVKDGDRIRVTPKAAKGGRN